MAKINEITEAKIVGAAKVTDILSDMGVKLSRRGASLVGCCPFHDDRNEGSFTVSEGRNICTCFAGCGTYNPKELLAKWKGWDLQKDYPKVLRYLAAKYSIYVDDEPVPQVVKSEPRSVVEEVKKPLLVMDKSIMERSLGNEDKNVLLQYLYGLPMCEEDMLMLHTMAKMYLVGTCTNGKNAGWTIWWQVDEQMRVRQGHMMAYKGDGHRDKHANHYVKDGKDMYYHTDWMESWLKRHGVIHTEAEPSQCLFGAHLVDLYPNAEICLVESEKSALICSAFTDPDKRLWMATAGMSNFTRDKLQFLIDRGRSIVVYPDKDGHDKWVSMAGNIGYRKLKVSDKVQTNWRAVDGEKADIADIMIRQLCHENASEAQKAAEALGRPDKEDVLGYMINRLDLHRTR